MHFETGNANEETWAGKLFLFVVFAKNVTNVLAEEAFDAFAKLLDAIDIQLGNFPFHSLAGLEGRDFAVDTIVPGNVGDKVFDAREGLHGQDRDGLILREIVHARFAGQARTPVDFGGTRTALAAFAVPTNSEIGSDAPLNVMERVETDHPRSAGPATIPALPAPRIP